VLELCLHRAINYPDRQRCANHDTCLPKPLSVADNQWSALIVQSRLG
jgi:hypothetical protein